MLTFQFSFTLKNLLIVLLSPGIMDLTFAQLVLHFCCKKSQGGLPWYFPGRDFNPKQNQFHPEDSQTHKREGCKFTLIPLKTALNLFFYSKLTLSDAWCMLK